MGSKMIAAVLLLSLLACIQAQSTVFDVTKFGAKPDADITQAVMTAWKQTCASLVPSTLLIPKGTYKLNAIEIVGPCKAPVEIRIDAILKAPPEPGFAGDKQWITINYLNNLAISGTGTFDGQGGLQAWKTNDCLKNKNCPKLPYNLSFNFVSNSTVTGITTQDSKNFHANVIGCNNLNFTNIKILAPGDSPNTDGLHIARSKNIYVLDSTIKTGDDCISIGDGMEQLHIERVTCGPGHGISIGSLGGSQGEQPVVGVYVKNCTFIKTMTGARIKTRPDSYPGIVSDLQFEDLIMEEVGIPGSPIQIEQEYCPSHQCTIVKPSLVKISNVLFKNIRGTSAAQVAVKLACSSGVPCENVVLSDIDLTHSGTDGPAIAECSNVTPKFLGKLNPPACGAAKPQ